ncbi:hypothetical protein A2996_01455 [Candidatus Campbellbacteria bacterium RIFCSPLOWO2_01_FULL_34_15]|uniref:Uncharacterized protein n=2 Tax=Candidatus Campbelliibacteriota TaxID=1752727 RepID=A0A1F5EPE5_9BACT|nr:MAG: hypothetical protein A2811_00635 [Candidatus Campbellbacteria bacterium RIFCSPHIGHO2_01_FULL_34_10]OGD69263.1 MAG: hypothetical protein A2996_01455 [Candidatus Campbellbacteria bacterium RIFCSPLOWO2_01_FULL_34_15]
MINKNSGFLQLVLVIIIGIIILSYFGFNLRGIVEAPQTQENLGYAWGLVTDFWNTYLAGPVLYFWNDIFIDLLWSSFVENMERIKAGDPTTIQEMAPSVNIQ